MSDRRCVCWVVPLRPGTGVHRLCTVFTYPSTLEHCVPCVFHSILILIAKYKWKKNSFIKIYTVYLRIAPCWLSTKKYNLLMAALGESVFCHIQPNCCHYLVHVLSPGAMQCEMRIFIASSFTTDVVTVCLYYGNKRYKYYRFRNIFKIKKMFSLGVWAIFYVFYW